MLTKSVRWTQANDCSLLNFSVVHLSDMRWVVPSWYEASKSCWISIWKGGRVKRIHYVGRKPLKAPKKFILHLAKIKSSDVNLPFPSTERWEKGFQVLREPIAMRVSKHVCLVDCEWFWRLPKPMPLCVIAMWSLLAMRHQHSTADFHLPHSYKKLTFLPWKVTCPDKGKDNFAWG